MSPSKDELAGDNAPTAPKISMKGFSMSVKPPPSKGTNNKRGTPSTSTSKTTTTLLGKRPRSALHHDESDESDDNEESHHRHGRHEEVTGFDIREGGAVKKTTTVVTGPLIIPKLKTRDFREEIRRARRGKNLLPPEVQAAQRAATAAAANGGATAGVKDVVNGEEDQPKWGLTITKNVDAVEKEGENGTLSRNGERDQTVQVQVSTTTTTTVTTQGRGQPPKREPHSEPEKAKSDEELALEALLGKSSSARKGPDLVISQTNGQNDDGNNDESPINETDAYRRAIASAPEVSTLEDYERVPVEEFGAAMLRGMGWKGPSESGGKNSIRSGGPLKEVKRRQNLLGLGAKELKEAEELGAWVQHSDSKRLKPGSSKHGGERRLKANEYREKEERRREERDERHGSYRRDRDRDRDRGYDRRH